MTIETSKLLDHEVAPRLGAGPDRLDSWKEIASYLKREVRTVQIWEKKEGLPVHRHFHNHLGTVFAFRSEIEAWGKQQATKQATNPPSAPIPVKEHSPRPIQIEITDLPEINSPVNYSFLCSTMRTQIVSSLECLDPSKVKVVESETPEGDLATAPALMSPDYQLAWDTRSQSDDLIITVSLVQTHDRLTVWSRSLPLSPDTTCEASLQVADQIVQCLWLKIVSSSRASLALKRIEKTSSREAYLKGRYFLGQRNEASMRKATAWFRTAIHEDPDFALPYSGLADSLTLLSFYEIESPSVTMPEARAAALKAIDLAPNVAEAHASLADIQLHFDRDWDGADQEYRRAIQCNPEYALGYHWYANLLSARGQHEAAHIAIMNALEIDPVSLITHVWAGVTRHLAHRFDEAILHYQTALELDPQYIWAHMYLAQTLEQKGQYEEALDEFEITITLAGGSNCVTAMKAHTLAAAGDKSAARSLLRKLRITPRPKCVPSYDIAATYAALGEPSQVAKWLKRACDERNMKLFKLRQDPRFDNVRHCAEFREVVQHIGLARYDAL
jgi:tetratricopeptide (TPR) repeat protein